MIMMNHYFICPLSLLLLLLIQGTMESFVSPTSFNVVVTNTKGTVSTLVRRHEASSSGLDYHDLLASSFQLADDAAAHAAGMIGDGVLKYPLGILVISLFSLALIFITKKIALAVEDDGDDEMKNKEDDDATKKERVPSIMTQHANCLGNKNFIGIVEL